jgi:hypothetical protein
MLYPLCFGYNRLRGPDTGTKPNGKERAAQPRELGQNERGAAGRASDGVRNTEYPKTLTGTAERGMWLNRIICCDLWVFHCLTSHVCNTVGAELCGLSSATSEIDTSLRRLIEGWHKRPYFSGRGQSDFRWSWHSPGQKTACFCVLLP